MSIGSDTTDTVLIIRFSWSDVHELCGSSAVSKLLSKEEGESPGGLVDFRDAVATFKGFQGLTPTV